jgi:hypothetical protein
MTDFRKRIYHAMTRNITDKVSLYPYPIFFPKNQPKKIHSASFAPLG